LQDSCKKTILGHFFSHPDSFEKYHHFVIPAFLVTPAKAVVQKVLKRLDSGFRRNDDFRRGENKGRFSEVSTNQGLMRD
jgi:hypothetical protein